MAQESMYATWNGLSSDYTRKTYLVCSRSKLSHFNTCSDSWTTISRCYCEILSSHSCKPRKRQACNVSWDATITVPAPRGGVTYHIAINQSCSNTVTFRSIPSRSFRPVRLVDLNPLLDSSMVSRCLNDILLRRIVCRGWRHDYFARLSRFTTRSPRAKYPVPPIVSSAASSSNIPKASKAVSSRLLKSELACPSLAAP